MPKKRKPKSSRSTAWGKIQAQYIEVTLNYRDALYLCIQELCILERKLRENTDDLNAFCSDGFWKDRSKRPSPDNLDKIFHYLFHFVFDCGPNGGKNASDYKRAALELLTGNLPREKIAEELKKRGGIKGVLKDREVVNDRAYESESTDEKKWKVQAAAESETSEKKTSSLKSNSINSEDKLVIGLENSKELCDVLELLEAEPLWLKVRLVGSDPSGFKRIVLENYDTR